MIMNMVRVSSIPPGVAAMIDNSGNPRVSFLSDMVQSGAAIEYEIAELENQLREINGAIADEAQEYIGHAENLHIQDVGVYCMVTLGSEILVEDVDTLREILGADFDALVKTTTCRPEPRLIAMAADADNPQSKQIAACLRVDGASSVVHYYPYA